MPWFSFWRVPSAPVLLCWLQRASYLIVADHSQVSYDPEKGRYVVQLAAKSIGEHTSLAPRNLQQIVYGVRILRGFRSTGAGDDDGGTTSTTNLAGQSCLVVGSAAVEGSDDWEHLVELNSDKECIPLAELTRLPPEAIRLPVCALPVSMSPLSRTSLY